MIYNIFKNDINFLSFNNKILSSNNLQCYSIKNLTTLSLMQFENKNIISNFNTFNLNVKQIETKNLIVKDILSSPFFSYKTLLLNENTNVYADKISNINVNTICFEEATDEKLINVLTFCKNDTDVTWETSITAAESFMTTISRKNNTTEIYTDSSQIFNLLLYENNSINTNDTILLDTYINLPTSFGKKINQYYILKETKKDEYRRNFYVLTIHSSKSSGTSLTDDDTIKFVLRVYIYDMSSIEMSYNGLGSLDSNKYYKIKLFPQPISIKNTYMSTARQAWASTEIKRLTGGENVSGDSENDLWKDPGFVEAIWIKDQEFKKLS